MSEHVSAQSIEQYRRRELAPAEILVVDDHLATCRDCYQLVRSDEDLQVALSALVGDSPTEMQPCDDHLTYEQLAALLDNQAGEVGNEIANVHLDVCSQCAAELKGLYALRETAPLPSGEPRRANLLTGWEQHFSFWRQPGGWAWPRLVGAVLAVLVVGTLALIIWQSQRSTEVVESTRPPVNSTSTTPSNGGKPLDLRSQAQPQPTPSPNLSPKIVVALKDGGGEVTLDEDGNVNGLGALSATSVNEAVKVALKTQRLNIAPALDGLRGKNGTLMGASNEGVPFALIAPLGSVLRSNRPTLRWRPLEGASTYIVKVYDTNFKEVASSTPQTTTEWRITSPLPRGVLYVWQVTASRNGEEIKSPAPPGPEARFKVLGRDKEVEVERAAKTYANSHLVLGTVYAEAGLLREAEREFRILLKANPDSQIAKELLREVTTASRKP